MITRDHGGNLDAAIDMFGGAVDEWIDLSTGINPQPYPMPAFPLRAWHRLPDSADQRMLIDAAREFWQIPDHGRIIAASGASSLIAQIPRLIPAGSVAIAGPTYNEHAAAFQAAGWGINTRPASAQVLVHPNNPDGKIRTTQDFAKVDLCVVDESFCDTCPQHSFGSRAGAPGVIILKSFGKFWGLAGLRLGFAIGPPDLIDPLGEMLGPWPVSGPALHIAAAALRDVTWAAQTRLRLAEDSARLDRIMQGKGAKCIGGTSLFRLYHVADPRAMQERLAQARIWSRIFPYSSHWIRLGLPPEGGWDQVRAA